MKTDSVLIVQSASSSGRPSNYISWKAISPDEANNLRLGQYVIPDSSYSKIRCTNGSIVFLKKANNASAVIIYGHLLDFDDRNRKIQFGYYVESNDGIYDIAHSLYDNLQNLGYSIDSNFVEEINDGVTRYKNRKISLAIAAAIGAIIVVICLCAILK